MPEAGICSIIKGQSEIAPVYLFDNFSTVGESVRASIGERRMGVHRQELFENQTVILDGNEFIHCEMRRCNLIYQGRDSVKLEHCQIAGCTWQFEDAAQRTVMMLKGLYLSGHVGKEIVEAIFRNV